MNGLHSSRFEVLRWEIHLIKKKAAKERGGQ
jgi:hypothetical protein